MGQVLHGRATTTETVRRAIQASQASVRVLARRYGISPTTVQKWRRRDHTTDAPMGPKAPRSTVLSLEDEAVVVAFRRHTLLPLDDCLYALQPSLPHLTRSALHRCLQRHGIARLPEVEGVKPPRSRFKAYPIGFFHIDLAEVRTAEGRLYLFVAVDRTSKFAFAQLHERATRRVAADFLSALVAAVPYRIHTVLTDNGTQFIDRTPTNEEAEAAAEAYWAAQDEPRIWRVHAFDHACERHGIEHRLTKPYHPWTNGQAERMNRTVKEATIKAFHYPDLDALRAHVFAFVRACNFAKHLKALRWRTPFQAVCDAWTKDPTIFKIDPHHLIPGPNT